MLPSTHEHVHASLAMHSMTTSRRSACILRPAALVPDVAFRGQQALLIAHAPVAAAAHGVVCEQLVLLLQLHSLLIQLHLACLVQPNLQ